MHGECPHMHVPRRQVEQGQDLGGATYIKMKMLVYLHENRDDLSPEFWEISHRLRKLSRASFCVYTVKKFPIIHLWK